MANRPYVLPELFNGEKDFVEWVDHFGDVAAINRWGEDAKLAWLKVRRLTDRAQTAFKRLPQSTKEKFEDAVKALKERFEPTSKRELYTAEFQVRRKERKQDWADFAQDLRMLADKAFPDLQMEARDCLSLNRFLDQITDPQINFAVKQRRPKTLDEAVAATLEMESYRTSAAIKGAVWQRIHTELKPWSGTKLIGPDGTAIAVQGTTTVTIMVGDGSFIADVVVVDGLIAEVLLGLDFLEQHNCTIQAGERLLTLKNGKIVIPLTSSDTVRKSPRMVVNLLQSVHIPPWSEIEVMAAGCGDVSSGVWIVEPTTNGKLPVLVARTVATPQNGCIPVRLLNLSSTSTKVSKGTTVGIMQAANEADIEVISNIRTQDSSPQVTSTPKELRDALWSAVEANKDLKESEKEQLYHLLLAYKDTFAHNQADLGRTDRVQHEVRTDDAYPIRQRVRRTAPAQREETRKLIEEMLHKDIIQPSSSPWVSPVVLVRKKDGSARFCVDYRRVNSVTKKDAYPLPRVDDTLDTLAGSLPWTSSAGIGKLR
ncbi:hypothetical protein EMCRGX_G033834 [Ephydatia muelleri]